MTLPAGWKSTALSQFVDLQRGFDLPSHNRIPGKYKVLSSGKASGSHNEGPVKGPGFVIGRATNLGRPTWSDDDYWPLNTVLFVRDFCGNDPKFAYYMFENMDLSGYDSGSVQPMLNRNYIANVELEVPGVREQRGIAATLSALDEKIESNRRAIELLQNLVRSVFLEWKDRFPSERSVTFGEFADVYGGATPKTGIQQYWDGDIAWATPTDITALSAPYLFKTARTISETGLASTSATLHPVGTILMTSRATIGAFAVNEVPTATNQGFIAVRPRDPEHRWFLLEEMRSRVTEMLDRANGSTFMELSRGNFKAMSIGLPNESGLAALHTWLAPLHDRSSQLDRECSRLAALRNTLLPELLSGRVRVPEADEVRA